MGTTNNPQPKFALSEYRKFIREAAPYVSLAVGRKLKPSDADQFSDEEIKKIALIIDERAGELSKRGPVSE